MEVIDNQKIFEWLHSWDTGRSSEAIAHFMLGARGVYFHYPLDPADFGRCYRLMQQIPEIRERLWEMRGVNPEWTALIDNWVELEALYEEELPQKSAPKLYARMKELIESAKPPIFETLHKVGDFTVTITKANKP